MEEGDTYSEERERMVREQLEARNIQDPGVLNAMRSIPRHLFVPPENRQLSYADGPLPIGQGQTISQPYIVALMTQLLALQRSDCVLEIGTGSGYQAAVLGWLAGEVHTVELHPELADRAREVLKEVGLTTVTVHVGDGSRGLPDHAPYQGIISTAAAPSVPRPLLDQLADGGRLVLPVGGPGGQLLEVWRRAGSEYSSESIVPVAFVPLRGLFGWDDEEWFPF